MDLEVLFRLGSKGILAASVTSADRPLLQAMLAPSSHTFIPCRMLALARKKSKDQHPCPNFQLSDWVCRQRFVSGQPTWQCALRAPGASAHGSRVLSIRSTDTTEMAACADVSDNRVARTSEGNAACCAEIRIIVDRAECVPGYRDISLFR